MHIEVKVPANAGLSVPESIPIVRILEISDWKILQTIRRRALQTNPGELYPKFAAEDRASPDRWRQELRSATWVTASPGDDPSAVGIACLLCCEGKWYLSSIWTDPRYRRRGFVRAMVNRLVEYAREDGSDEVHLWVFKNNRRAISAYRRLDFAETGIQQHLRWGRQRRVEIEMVRSLT